MAGQLAVEGRLAVPEKAAGEIVAGLGLRPLHKTVPETAVRLEKAGRP